MKTGSSFSTAHERQLIESDDFQKDVSENRKKSVVIKI